MYQSIQILNRQLIFGQVRRCYGIARGKNYYEILGISHNASKKEIRSAFIQLSKEKHPDRSSKDSKKSHADFVKINEAYNVLIKDSSKRQYDSSLKYGYDYNNVSAEASPSYGTSGPMYTWYDATMHARGEKFKEYRRAQGSQPPKTLYIVLCCVMLIAFGSTLRLWFIMKSSLFDRQESLNESMKLGNEYERVRMRAIMNRRSGDNNADIFIKLSHDENSEKYDDVKIVK